MTEFVQPLYVEFCHELAGGARAIITNKKRNDRIRLLPLKATVDGAGSLYPYRVRLDLYIRHSMMMTERAELPLHVKGSLV